MLTIDLIIKLAQSFSRKEKFRFYLLIISSLVSSFLELFIIFLVITALRLTINGEDFYFYEIDFRVPLNIYLFLTIIFVVFSSWYRYKNLYWVTKFSYDFSIKLSSKLFFSLLSKPFLFYKSSKSADLVDLLVIKNNAIGPSVVLPAIKWFAGTITLLTVGFTSLIFLGYTSLVALSIVMILFWMFSLRTKNIKNANSYLISKLNPLILNIINQAILGFRDVKLNKMEGVLLSRFLKLLKERSQVQISNEMISLGPKIVIEGVVFSILLIFIFYLIQNAANKTDSFLLIGLIALGVQKFIPVAQQIYVSTTTLRLNNSIFNEIMDFSNFITVPIKDTTCIDVFKDSIRFDNVSYQYPDGREVIKNLSLQLNSGDLVAICGKSGVGKSTFLDLFIGFLPPSSGKVISDGKLVHKDFGVANVAYVPQRNYIFNGNFIDNIALASHSDDVNWDRFIQALKISQLFDYVESLPKKELTDLGEDGGFLSGGLRQRVGIARAIYMNRPIILLDEATSGLDWDTENLLFNNLFDYCRKSQKLCIVVTHKIEILRKFKLSYVLKNKTLHIWCDK